MVQGKINRGRHTDHLAGCHSVRTKQCPPPPSPHFFTDWMPFLPPNQQYQSTEGNLTELSKYCNNYGSTEQLDMTKFILTTTAVEYNTIWQQTTADVWTNCPFEQTKMIPGNKFQPVLFTHTWLYQQRHPLSNTRRCISSRWSQSLTGLASSWFQPDSASAPLENHLQSTVQANLSSFHITSCTMLCTFTVQYNSKKYDDDNSDTTTVLRPLFQEHLGEPAPEENFCVDFMVQGKINTDNLAGRHSMRTNQCPPPPSSHFFTGQMPFLPPNQQCQSTEGN